MDKRLFIDPRSLNLHRIDKINPSVRYGSCCKVGNSSLKLRATCPQHTNTAWHWNAWRIMAFLRGIHQSLVDFLRSRLVKLSFDIFSVVFRDKLLNQSSSGVCFRKRWCSCNIYVTKSLSVYHNLWLDHRMAISLFVSGTLNASRQLRKCHSFSKTTLTDVNKSTAWMQGELVIQTQNKAKQQQGHILLMWIIINTRMDKQLLQLRNVRWNYLSIPKLQRLHSWSLGMDE